MSFMIKFGGQKFVTGQINRCFSSIHNFASESIGKRGYFTHNYAYSNSDTEIKSKSVINGSNHLSKSYPNIEYSKRLRKINKHISSLIDQYQPTNSFEISKFDHKITSVTNQKSTCHESMADLLDSRMLLSELTVVNELICDTESSINSKLSPQTHTVKSPENCRREEVPGLSQRIIYKDSSTYGQVTSLDSINRNAGFRKKSRGLESSLRLEPELKEFWYPVEFSRTLETNTIVPLELFNVPWILFRRDDGQPSCIRDSCAHRACPLSLGKLSNGEVCCAYHGWSFNGNGECTAMPSTVFIKNIHVDSLHCIEVDGLIWVYPGTSTPPKLVAHKITKPPRNFDIHAELLLEVPVEHGLLIENLLDLAHAPFTHTNTFAKGWPIPDLVAFKTVEMLGGHWHPYPIDMSFVPPCMTLSTVGLAQPGKIEKGQRQEDCRNRLHQLHVCLPARKGMTRLLYRMSLDFIPWARNLPFMYSLWKRVADQVLNEDLRLILGQQENLVREGPKVTWANPVPYDKLAVRYRRWRNNLDKSL